MEKEEIAIDELFPVAPAPHFTAAGVTDGAALGTVLLSLEKVRVEFERILRPGGWVALVSNSRVREDSPISVAYEAVLREHGTDYAANRDRYEIAARVDAFFAGGEVFREESFDEQRLTLEELVGQTQSYSVTPAPGHEKFEGMQSALRRFFSEWGRDGVVVTKTVCKVTGGRFAQASDF